MLLLQNFQYILCSFRHHIHLFYFSYCHMEPLVKSCYGAGLGFSALFIASITAFAMTVASGATTVPAVTIAFLIQSQSGFRTPRNSKQPNPNTIQGIKSITDGVLPLEPVNSAPDSVAVDVTLPGFN